MANDCVGEDGAGASRLVGGAIVFCTERSVLSGMGEQVLSVLGCVLVNIVILPQKICFR